MALSTGYVSWILVGPVPRWFTNPRAASLAPNIGVRVPKRSAALGSTQPLPWKKGSCQNCASHMPNLWDVQHIGRDPTAQIILFSVPVAPYVAFAHEEQEKNGIAPKQAPGMLRPDLRRLLKNSMRTQLATESRAPRRIALVRDIRLLLSPFRLAVEVTICSMLSDLVCSASHRVMIYFQFLIWETSSDGGCTCSPRPP